MFPLKNLARKGLRKAKKGKFQPCTDFLRPSDASVIHWTRPPLVQVMAWCLFGSKPLSDPLMIDYELDT